MWHIFLLPLSLFSLIDFLGVFAGALGGAFEAARHKTYNYDFIGVLGLSLASAIGGGVTRDILIQKGPPLAFEDVRYLLAALAGSLLALVFGRKLGKRTQNSIVLMDAAAIGLFAVAGSTRALDAGLKILPALILGVITAVGGGSLRDVLSGRTPKIFEHGQPYAIAACLASATFLVCNSLELSRELSTFLGGMIGFSVRMLAMRYNWKTRAVRFSSASKH